LRQQRDAAEVLASSVKLAAQASAHDRLAPPLGLDILANDAGTSGAV
jgi:hypothetical protein